MRLLLPLLLAALVACDTTPPYVENSDIDQAMALGKPKTVCVGVKMKDDTIRRYATERLSEVEDPIALECVCERIFEAETGRWDASMLDGLKGTARDDMVECALPALDHPKAEDKEALVVALLATRSEAAVQRLISLAQDSSADSILRARAVSALNGRDDEASVALLHKTLASDSVPEVRAAAAKALIGRKDKASVDALIAAFEGDSEGQVRAAALDTVRRQGGEAVDALICKAMLDDASPEVRRQAVMAFRGTKRDEAVACLRKRAFTAEEDGSVREALISALKASPNPKAAEVLCDAIPFYMKTYITDKTPTEVTGADLGRAQNDRDWETSYACFQKALRSRGAWSCHGQQYVANWFREVGGKTFVPRCAGDEGYGEVSFE